MSTTGQGPMSTAEALGLVGNLLSHRRALERGQELLQILAGAEQRIVDLNAEIERLGATAAAARTELAKINATAEQAREAARAATAAKAAAIAEHERMAAQAKADADTRIAEAKAEAERVVAQERAATERQVADLAAQIAAKRAELDGVEASLAALRAKLGA